MDPGIRDALQYQRARFATQLPRSWLYTPSHFWVARVEPEVWHIGLTKFGSRMLGEVVDYAFELGAGARVTSGHVIGWIEGFKAVSDLVSVADGVFAGANAVLEQQITLVNQDPQGAGWLYAVKGTPDSSCVDVDRYAAILDATIDQLLQG